MTAPCRLCGVATDRAVEAVQKQSPSGAWGGPPYRVGTCAECEGLRPLEPGVAVRAALRVLGRDERDDALAAAAFDRAGLDVSHVLHDSGHRGGREPQRKAWGHVEREFKADLRAAYVAVLDAKVHASTGPARPVPEGPPPGGRAGCSACGVARSASWRAVRVQVTRGTHTGEALCRDCAEAHDVVGAWGPTLFERSALAAKGIEWSPDLVARGLRPWAALGLPPNDEPWGHVEFRLPEPEPTLRDLAAQVAALAAAVGRLEARP